MLKRTLLAAAAALTVSPLSLQAQNPIRDSLKGVFDLTRENIMATARDLSPELYAYRPTAEVRSTGQILAHVADAQYMFCSTAAGEQSPATESVEQTRTQKQQIVEALEQSFQYCERVFANIPDSRGGQSVTLMGMQTTAFGSLAFNSAHNYEHYGNLVTYMRLNGIVPPSSR